MSTARVTTNEMKRGTRKIVLDMIWDCAETMVEESLKLPVLH